MGFSICGCGIMGGCSDDVIQYFWLIQLIYINQHQRQLSYIQYQQIQVILINYQHKHIHKINLSIIILTTMSSYLIFKNSYIYIYKQVMQGLGAKQPLCKFINDCREYKKNGNCIFRHDKCRNGPACKQQTACKFYHPELQGKISRPNPNSSIGKPTSTSVGKQGSNLSNIPCKFGDTCRNKQLCQFNHDLPPPPRGVSRPPRQGGQGQQQCKFGDKCKNLLNGTCKFKHSGRSVTEQLGDIGDNNQNNQQQQTTNTNNINTNNNNNNTNNYFNTSAHTNIPQPTTTITNNTRTITNNQPQIQITLNYNAQYQQFQTKKLCKNHAVGQCNTSECSFSHFFTLDNSLKRTYTKIFPHPLLCSGFKLGQTRVYALAIGKNIAFYELDTNLQVLKSVCQFQLGVDANIGRMCVITEGQGVIVVFTAANSRIYKYNVLQGILNQSQYGSPFQFVGAVGFLQEGIMLMGNKVSGLLVEANGSYSTEIKNKICGNPDLLNKITIIKKFNILGQQFLALGTQQGNIAIINKNLESKTIPIPNASVIDLHATKVNEKPILFIVFCEHGRKYQVVAMSLLDFSYETFLLYQGSKISKICINVNRIFVAIDGVGVLVYYVQELPKLKGRIPLQGKISHIQCDNDGNLLILQQKPQNQFSMSTYMLRK